MDNLIIKKDYVMYRFYKYGEDDTFDYFYWRNYDVFKYNNRFSKINIEGYDRELYPIEELKLKNSNLISHNCFVLPKGKYECKCYKSKHGTDLWLLNINGIILNIKDLSKNNKEYFEIIK